MTVKFDKNEKFDSLQALATKFKDYVDEHRQGFSIAHSTSKGLKNDEIKTLGYYSIDMICWCGGEYKPNENGKRKCR